jgi:hypothetical protein
VPPEALRPCLPARSCVASKGSCARGFDEQPVAAFVSVVVRSGKRRGRVEKLSDSYHVCTAAPALRATCAGCWKSGQPDEGVTSTGQEPDEGCACWKSAHPQCGLHYFRSAHVTQTVHSCGSLSCSQQSAALHPMGLRNIHSALLSAL